MKITDQSVIKAKIYFASIITPLGLDEQHNRLEPVANEDIDPVDIDLAETISVGDTEARTLASHLRKSSSEDRRNACATLLSMPRAIENCDAGWRAFLLCLLSTVAGCVISALPSLPIVVLTGLTTAPRALRLFIESFSPFRELTGKRGSIIRRPAVMAAVAPLGSTTVSSDPVDYLGGKLKVSGFGRLNAWLPLALVPVAVATNVPDAVLTALLAASPLALLILCGARKVSTPRYTFRWDGAAFETADLDFLDHVESQLPLIQSQLLCFNECVHSKKGRRNRIVEGMSDFFPVSHVGRFAKVLDADPEVRIWAAALSALKEFLRFAVKQDWICQQAAQWTLTEAWVAVLPESAPTPPSENSVAVRGDSVAVFWSFLADYVRERLPLVTDKPRSDPAAIATLATFDDGRDGRFVVFPRGQLVEQYNIYLDQHRGAPLSIANDGIELAHLLHESWGVPIRTEQKKNAMSEDSEDSGDLTWRYQFFARGTAPEGQRDKLPCIGIPLTALPNELRSLLDGGSDLGSGEGNTSPAARTPPDLKSSSEVSENA